MKCLSVGQRLFLSVLSVFLIFSVCFIVFQQYRERLYKVSMLEQRLMDYNDRMNEFLHLPGNKESLSDKKIDRYVRQHSMKDLRVTLIRPDGRVFYDNINKDYAHIANHSNRQEVVDALAKGRGSTVERVRPLIATIFIRRRTFPATISSFVQPFLMMRICRSH